MKAGFALLPNKDFSQYFVSFQARLFEFMELTPKLSCKDNLPHTSLLQGEFVNHANYENILSQVLSYTQNTFGRDLFIKIDRFKYVDIGWFFLLLKKDTFIKN